MEHVVGSVGRREPLDLVDRTMHRLLHPVCRRGAVPVGDRIEAHRQDRGRPATVAARGSEADVLGIDDDDLQPGPATTEIPGGPQAGVTGTDDHDVGVGGW